MKMVKNSVWKIGKNYMIRTVTMIQVGQLVSIDEYEIVLKDAAWVADTGRFNEFLAKGTASEIEPFPDGIVLVGRSALIDACEWKHGLLRQVK